MRRRRMGPSNNPPRRHHFIPEFWSKRWTSADGRALRYTMPVPGKIVARRKPPSAIGWRTALYEIPGYREQPENFEIRFFRRVDQQASDLFDLFENQSRINLNPDQLRSFSLFIVSLLHRAPAAVETLQKSTVVTVTQLIVELREKYDIVRGPNDPLTFDEYYERYDDTMKLSHLSIVFASLLLSKNITSFISKLSWFRLKLESAKHSLLLSDDPLIRTNGLMKNYGHLALPISPKLAMVGLYNRRFFDQLSSMSPDAIVTEMNSRTVEAARDFVLAQNEKQDRFIRNRFGRNLRPTLIEQSANQDLSISLEG